MTSTETGSASIVIEPRAPEARAAAWWMLAVLSLTALVSYSDRLILSVLVDDLRADLGLTDSSIGLIQGPAFTLVYVFASLSFGRLADLRKRRTLLIAGASVWCVATVLCGAAPNSWTLLAGRLLLGAGEAALVPAAVSMIADAFPPHRRGLALGVFLMGTILGGPLGITVGGVLLTAINAGVFHALPLVAAYSPWRIVLVTVGVVGLMAPLLLLTVAEPRRLQKGGADLKATVGHFRGAYSRLLPLYAGLAMLSIGDYGLVSWVPAALSRRFGWQSDQIGVAFGITTAAAGVVGSLAGGWFADLAERRGGPRARLGISIAAAMLATSAAAAISGGQPEWVLIGLGAWVLISSIGEVAAIAVIQDLVPTQFRGTAMALLTFSNTLVGLGCGPTLIGLTTDYVYGIPVAVDRAISTVAIPAGILGSVLFAIARRRVDRSTATALRI